MESDALFTLGEPAGAPSAHAGSGGVDGFTAAAADSPLPVRMRPAGIDELVGQDHLLAPGAPLRQLVEAAAPMSVILWGPPGSG
ncbi:replication-associated recombination protein A, partial [Micromonospora chersina]